MSKPLPDDSYTATHLPLVGDVPCPVIVARLPDPPPLVMGGQDRADSDVEGSAVGFALVVVMIMAVGIGAWFVLGAIGVPP